MLQLFSYHKIIRGNHIAPGLQNVNQTIHEDKRFDAESFSSARSSAERRPVELVEPEDQGELRISTTEKQI